MTSFNYIWQGGYLPPVVPSTHCQPPYESTPDLSQANSQAANPSFSASCNQYVHQRTPTSEVSPNPGTDFYLKVINPANKKDFQLYTMRSLSPDVDSPDKLKNALSEQYGDLLPPTDKMEIGYFHQSKKMWIKNRLDLNCNIHFSTALMKYYYSRDTLNAQTDNGILCIHLYSTHTTGNDKPQHFLKHYTIT